MNEDETKLLSLAEIRRLLYDRNLQKVADAVGCSRAYLHTIRSGRTVNPSYRRLVALSNYFASNAARS